MYSTSTDGPDILGFIAFHPSDEGTAHFQNPVVFKQWSAEQGPAVFLSRVFMSLIYDVQFYAFQYLFDFEYVLFGVARLLSCQKSKTYLLTPARTYFRQQYSRRTAGYVHMPTT
jgi:hypothetical protein